MVKPTRCCADNRLGGDEPFCPQGHVLTTRPVEHWCAPRYISFCPDCADYDTPAGYGDTKAEALSDYVRNTEDQTGKLWTSDKGWIE